MTIALLAIMLDEAAYADRWCKTVERAKALGLPFDQVLVIDGGSTDDTVARLGSHGVHVISRPFSGHFADQRNFGIDQCITDWIFELDADEVPATPLLAGLRDIARDMEKAAMDCVGIARLNLLDGKLVPSPGHNGLDYQYRLHHRACHWRGAVHEEITGYRMRFELPIFDGHFLVHDKTSARHEARNAYYGTLVP